jgi:hypothetical protein
MLSAGGVDSDQMKNGSPRKKQKAHDLAAVPSKNRRSPQRAKAKIKHSSNIHFLYVTVAPKATPSTTAIPVKRKHLFSTI